MINFSLYVLSFPTTSIGLSPFHSFFLPFVGAVARAREDFAATLVDSSSLVFITHS